ncbi:MAG TPA: SUMF1/EgtB/PvdO family nonheme iron enzyme [Chthoniobacterales bacterium]|nr:SUMF1/EgtB/PvdO family nonheme iron enzyme [Chthoniobacterales bacterium]
MTTKCEISFPLPLPDDPNKWDGWSKYKSPNLYERLCLDPRANPSNELIEEHCRELMRWWQKKLPLKSQPSNPLAQLLQPGLDESSRYLTEARTELLDPARRRAMDNEIAAQMQEEAAAELHKYITFAVADGILTAEAEKNLFQFGADHGLAREKIQEFIDAELRDSGAKRAAPPPPKPASGPRPRRRGSLDPKQDFMRMLRLSALDGDSMSDEQRDMFVNMAENLGLEAEEAEDLIDEYLDQADDAADPDATVAVTPARPEPGAQPPPAKTESPAESETRPIVVNENAERAHYVNYSNSAGGQMIFIPSAEFTMGSEAPDAAPNERPLTRVTLTRFYLSRFPVTNAEYEEFDPTHSRKRPPGAGDRHPVVYVSSLDAMKYCQWLSARERKRYRLPTEAEWEYAAKGKEGRKYPWGSYDRRGDLGNFADRNTVFPWSDREIDDGFPESSPVGSYPRGASPFGIEDMAGNVWEWCLDYYETYRGVPRVNPKGPTSGAKRVHRGGSWKSRFNNLRSTARGSNVPNFSCNDIGFRVACECE